MSCLSFPNTLYPDVSILAQPTFDFPQSLTDRYQPKRIADFCGLTNPREILSGFAARPRATAWTFTGPSGTGKTTMGQALALEMELNRVGA